MREIQLTQGHVALVDDEDHSTLSGHRWFVARHGSRGEHLYAVRNAPGKNGTLIRMHVEIVGRSFVDHRDGNGLNNQRSNLRECTRQENGRNRRKQTRPTTSRYKGVSWRKDCARWSAYIYAGERRPNGKKRRINLGLFGSELEAAVAYDAAAIQHFGSFAKLNIQERA